MTSRWWLVLERVQAGLPVLGAAALAGFTWWLVQSSPSVDEGRKAQPVSSAPDYEMDQARLARFNAQGQLDAVVEGEIMRHYAHPDRVVIDQVVMIGRDAQGQGIRATAQEGEANQDAQRVSLRGGATVVTTPVVGRSGAPATFQGNVIEVDLQNKVLTAPEPIVFTQAGNVVRAKAMRHDERTGVTVLSGRVTGQYQVSAR